MAKRKNGPSKTTAPPGQPIGSVQTWLPSLSDTGQHITPRVAIAYSTVYACVQLLADSVAGLPWEVFERRGGSLHRAEGHEWTWPLGVEPNPDMDSFTFRQTMMLSVLLTGNGYAQIVEDGPQRGLYYLRPDFVTPMRRDGELVYLYSGEDPRAFLGREVFHIRAIGFDGLVGQSPIAIARNAIGAALGQESYSASFFRNGARPSGVLSLPGKLDPDAQARLRQQWESLHAGSSNSGRTAILEQGMKWQPLSVPSDDAQFLESRQFQRVEICSIFRVPPHMVGDQTGSSYSNNEQANTEFVQHTLRSWVTRWEMESLRKLFGRGPYFSRMSFGDLVRGDQAARATYYQVMKSIGAISANEIRAKEGENSIGPEGDVYTMSQNETPVDQKIAEGRPSPPKPKEPVPDSVDADPEPEDGIDAAYADWATETIERLLRVELHAAQRKRSDWTPKAERFRDALHRIAVSAEIPTTRASEVADELCRWMQETDSDRWLSILPVRGAEALLGACHAV